jgi:hypothetical protein
VAGEPGFEPGLTESESPRRVLVCHASSSGSETSLRIRSLAGYIVGTLESRFRKRQVDLRRLWNAKRLAESAPGLELCLIHDSPEAKMTGVIIDAVTPNAGSLQGRRAGAPSHDACWAACAAEVTRATRRLSFGIFRHLPLDSKKTIHIHSHLRCAVHPASGDLQCLEKRSSLHRCGVKIINVHRKPI